MSTKSAAAITFGLILLALSFAYYSVFSWLPTSAESRLTDELRELGFSITQLPKPETRIGGLRYHEIDLDPEGRSYIESLTVHYALWDMLAHKKFKALDLKNIYLSGDLNANNTLNLAGINNPEKLINLNAASFQTVNIQNMTLSLLTAQLGGIRLTGNMQIINEDEEMRWTGFIESKQNQLELIAKLTGSMRPNLEWYTDIEIENGKIENDIGKITRLSGYVSFFGQKTTITKITSDLKAGGMEIMGLPWQNASITANGAPNDLSLFISGRSLGVDELELGFEGKLQNENFLWDARIYAPNIQSAFDYLNLQDNFSIPKTIIKETNIKENAELIFVKRKNNFLLTIKDAQSNKVAKQFLLEQQQPL